MTIKCITFDLDDTLWAVSPVVKAANEKMLYWLSVNAPLFDQTEGIAALNKVRKLVLAEQPDIAHSVSKIRIEILKKSLLDAGYQVHEAELLAKQAFDEFYQARQEVDFFEQALPMLDQLKQQGYLLGAISNGNADIHQVGLAQYMDFQFSADQVGVQKPDAEIFRQMLSHTQLKPEQVIHIGDHPEHDIAGAQASGLWSIWVNLDQQSWDQAQNTNTPKADEDVCCLSEIPEAVQRISSRARL